MSYGSEQITEKGRQPRSKPSKKWAKKSQTRYLRNKLKDINYTPHPHKYTGGWVD